MFTLSGFGDEISPDLNEQMDVMESEGIKHIELRGVNNTGVLELADAEISEIKGNLKKRGFKISAIGSPIGKVGIEDDFDEHLKKFERAVYLADYFQTGYIRIFSYYIPEGKKPVDYRDEVMRRMRKKAEIAAEQGITLLHENEHGIYGDTSDRCRDIVTTVSSPNLRALFDPANFVVEGEHPYSSAYPKLSEFIEYLHIKDAKFSDELEITPAGEGNGDIPEILGALRQRGFDGFLSLEPHLAVAGSKGGFSGPEQFKRAARALKKVLHDIGAEGF
jgi:sugar phosphate isomerase/epimerase